MNRLMLYRAFLALYPREFRQKFSDEMVGVFQQRIDEGSTRQGLGAALALSELFGLLKGAPRAWVQAMHKKHFVFSVPLISDYLQRPIAEENALSTQELQQRHDMAQSSMFQAAASGDRITARNYEPEVARLRYLLKRRSRRPRSNTKGDV